MTFEQESPLQVTYCNGKHTLNVGRLILSHRKIFFEYSSIFLESGLELSPFKLPLKGGVFSCAEQVFEGLFGLFNDSLPDGWGRRLLDRKLMNLGINPNTITPIDRLKYVGTHGMGALKYEPEIIGISSREPSIELDLLADECAQFQIHDQGHFIDDLIIMNGSSAGARPKILVNIDPETGQFRITNNNPLHSHHDWIVKFRSSVDPLDIGPIEYAYHLMAKEAGLEVPGARLFKSRKGPGYFGVQRFDRTEHTFFHTHTLSGLLHADHRIPSLDYETVMKATYILTKSLTEMEKQFRNAVFNVFAYNRDDHAKNFSFIMDEKGIWTVSPAYDLTFSTGPGGEHCTTVMGNGRNPGVPDLLKLAIIAKINEQKARSIIDEVRHAVAKWKHFAELASVSKQSSKNIHAFLSHLGN